jgi:hypothetical protein
MLQSKFRFWVWVPFVCSLFLLVIIITVIYNGIEKSNLDNPASILLASFFFGFVLLWLVWGELRTKAIKVSIEIDRIEISRFLGFGISKTIQFSEFDGFKISFLPSDNGLYEYLYIMKDKQKVIKLSEFYHGNYKELKNMLSSKLNDLGVEKFSYWQELKEIFA